MAASCWERFSAAAWGSNENAGSAQLNGCDHAKPLTLDERVAMVMRFHVPAAGEACGAASSAVAVRREGENPGPCALWWCTSGERFAFGWTGRADRQSMFQDGKWPGLKAHLAPRRQAGGGPYSDSQTSGDWLVPGLLVGPPEQPSILLRSFARCFKEGKGGRQQGGVQEK
jgi:hypothetical protein